MRHAPAPFSTTRWGGVVPLALALSCGVAWSAAVVPDAGTPEARLYSDFLRPRDWANWAAD